MSTQQHLPPVAQTHLLDQMAQAAGEKVSQVCNGAIEGLGAKLDALCERLRNAEPGPNLVTGALSAVKGNLPNFSKGANEDLSPSPTPIAKEIPVERPPVPQLQKSPELDAAISSFKGCVSPESHACSADQLGTFDSTHFRGTPVQTQVRGIA